MDGLQRITARIAADSETEASELLQHAQEDAHQKLCHYQKAADETRARRLAQGRTQAEDLIHQTVSAAELDARKRLLSVKQEMVSEVFETVLDRLQGLSDPEYIALLVRLAVKASATGEGIILLNAKDLHRHGEALVAEANQALGKKGEPARLTLSPETLPITGGLILREGRVETNCSFEAILRLAQKEMTADVARLLFGPRSREGSVEAC